MNPPVSTNHTINQLQDQDRCVHDWYRFVLSFPAHLVQQHLDDFAARPGQTVLDPFCGTGTTLVEARKAGLTSIGIEANPMTHFASAVKTNWEIDPEALEIHSEDIAQQANELFVKQGLHEHSDLPLFAHAQATAPALRTLDAEQEKLLLTGSISPRPLHRLLELRDLIEAAKLPWTDHQRLALATTAVADASNLRFGPEVGVSRRKKQDAAVVNRWLARMTQIANDLRTLQDRPYPPAQVYFGDARAAAADLSSQAHFVITSPPYPNEKDYTRATRLESVLLGFMSNRQELRRIKKRLLRSNTRNVYAKDDDDTWIKDFRTVMALAAQIEARREELGKTSGFEKLYHRVVSLYFGGMHRHLRTVSTMLAPGALCAYVVGDQESFFRITIRTGELLAEIAEHCGYQVERLNLWRTRAATATGTQLREEVLVLRWPG